MVDRRKSTRTSFGAAFEQETTLHGLWSQKEFNPAGAPAGESGGGRRSMARGRESEGGMLAFEYPPLPSPAANRQVRRSSRKSLALTPGSHLAAGRRSTFGTGGAASPATPMGILERTPGQMARMPRFSTASPWSGRLGDSSPPPDVATGGGVPVGLGYDPFAERPARRSRARLSTAAGLGDGAAGDELDLMDMDELGGSGARASIASSSRHSLRQSLAGTGGDEVAFSASARMEEEGFGAILSTFSGVVDNGGDHDLFSLLHSYEQICDDRFSYLKNAERSRRETLSVAAHVGKIKAEKVLLRDERNTWRLVRNLYYDRWRTMALGEEGELAAAEEREQLTREFLAKRVSEADLVERLFATDAELRQHHLVVGWLESTASEELAYAQDDVSWVKTIEALKNRAAGLAAAVPGNLVDHADPDAPFRDGSGKAIHPDDAEAEDALLAALWTLIRCGKVQDAIELCRDCNQPWRAATLSGGFCYQDPFMSGKHLHADAADGAGGDGGDMAAVVEGNPSRNLWKSVCSELAEQARNRHERAMYGLLSGNLACVAPACETYEDHMWANFRSLVDLRVNQELASFVDPMSDDVPSTAGDHAARTVDDVFEALRPTADEVHYGADAAFHTIQKLIICGDVDGLMAKLAEWVNTVTPACPPQVLRFGAHLVLFFHALGVELNETHWSDVIEAYTNHLIDSRQTSLVAVYTARLPSHLQVPTYARFLETVDDDAEREYLLSLGKQAGLDVGAITKTVVTNIRSQLPPEVDMPLNQETSDADARKISSLQWLCFDLGQRAEALSQANALMREFLSQGKLDACERIVSSVLPTDTIDVLQADEAAHEPSSTLARSLVEFHSIGLYLEANRVHAIWKEHHAVQPEAPGPAPPADALYSTRLQHETAVKSYQERMATWRDLDLHKSNAAVDAIVATLTDDDGWLVDAAAPASLSDAEQRRADELIALRRLCLPGIVFMLHAVMVDSNQLERSLTVPDLVADSRYGLHEVFSREELQHLLRLAVDSRIQLLRQREQGEN